VCELLANHIPDDEAMLLKNGRLDLLLFGDSTDWVQTSLVTWQMQVCCHLWMGVTIVLQLV